MRHQFKTAVEESPSSIPPISKDFTPTQNRMGYMSPGLDIIQGQFVEHCEENPSELFLDIGCGDGVATLPVIEKGCRIVACDLGVEHLKTLKARVPKKRSSLLVYAPGHFPKAVHFPEAVFSGVNMSMLMHFFSPSTIEKALQSIFLSLKEKGKLFITTSSPYQRVLTDFLPLYKEKVGVEEYPGCIEDISNYAPHRAHFLPKRNIVFCPDELRRIVSKYGFKVLQATSFSREGLPTDIKFDGREYSGVVCEKPGASAFSLRE